MKNIGKILKPIGELLVDAIPLGGSVKKVVGFTAKSVWKNLDKNQDGKVTIDEVPWWSVVALLGISIALRYGIVTKETLTITVEIMAKILGG